MSKTIWQHVVQAIQKNYKQSDQKCRHNMTINLNKRTDAQIRDSK